MKFIYKNILKNKIEISEFLDKQPYLTYQDRIDFEEWVLKNYSIDFREKKNTLFWAELYSEYAEMALYSKLIKTMCF